MSRHNPYSRAPLHIELGAVSVEVAYAPSAVWAGALSSGHGPVTLLTALTDAAAGDRILHGLVDGSLHLRDVQEAAYALLAEATPYSWWKAARLLTTAGTDVMVGNLALAGVDPWSVSASQLACTVYVLMTRNLDVSKKFQMDAELDNPPAGVVDDSWMSDQDFNALVAQ